MDFLILGLIDFEWIWCALRLRSWTSLTGYRLNRAQVPYFCLFRYAMSPWYMKYVLANTSLNDQYFLSSNVASIILTPRLFLKIPQTISTVPLWSFLEISCTCLGQVQYICTRPSSMCAYGVILTRIELLILSTNNIFCIIRRLWYKIIFGLPYPGGRSIWISFSISIRQEVLWIDTSDIFIKYPIIFFGNLILFYIFAW